MAGQAVVQLQPAQLLGGVDVALGLEALGIVQGAEQEVDLLGPARALVGDRRAAAAAEGARHAGRGGVACRAALGEGHPVAGVAGVGDQRRAGGSPAALAVAVGDPERRPLGEIADRPAEAAAAAPLGFSFRHDRSS